MHGALELPSRKHNRYLRFHLLQGVSIVNHQSIIRFVLRHSTTVLIDQCPQLNKDLRSKFLFQIQKVRLHFYKVRYGHGGFTALTRND